MTREQALAHAAKAEDLLSGHRSQAGWVGEYMSEQEVGLRAAAHASLAAAFAMLAEPEPLTPLEPILELGIGHDYGAERELRLIRFELEKFNRHRRRPRLIECKHPELHEEAGS